MTTAIILLFALSAFSATALDSLATGSAPRTGSERLGIGSTIADWYADRIWQNPQASWNNLDLFSALKANGFDWLRVGVTTLSYPQLENISVSSHPVYQSGFWSSREYDLGLLQAGAQAGMNLDLFFFLSDHATYGGEQQAPSAWENFTLQQTASALEQSNYNITEYFIQKGLKIGLYEIGNEIDFGVAGYSLDTKLSESGIDVLHNTSWDAQNVWNKEAVLFNASIAGVKRADPQARIVLHLALSNYPSLVKAFFQTMSSLNVPYDYGGLSYYPWIVPTGQNSPNSTLLSESIGGIAGLGKGVIIDEYSFPSTYPSSFEPSSWVEQVPGYSFTPSGQSEWIHGFLSNMSEDSRVDGAFYFYPEDYPSNGTGVASLFYNDTTPKPSLYAFTNLPSITGTSTSSSTTQTTTSNSFASSQTVSSSTSYSNTQRTTTTSSKQGGGGGIPEFPYQLLAVAAFAAVVVVSYLVARVRVRMER